MHVIKKEVGREGGRKDGRKRQVPPNVFVFVAAINGRREYGIVSNY